MENKMTTTTEKTIKYKDSMISRRKLLIASSSVALAGILNQYNPKKILAASGNVVSNQVHSGCTAFAHNHAPIDR